MYELLRAYLENIQFAIEQGQRPHAEAMLAQAQAVLARISPPLASTPFTTFHLEVAVGHHLGTCSTRTRNEDSLFAAQAIRQADGEQVGLFIVADGMGGHADGQEASRIALHTIVETVFPVVVGS